jgi:dihydroneopterin aldolase
MSDSSKDVIRVFLRDCKINLSIGVYPAEMIKPQQVIVNVEVESEPPQHYRDITDRNLDHVIDYDPLYHYICAELPKLGHIPLLETVADKIIDFCFSNMRVQKVRVRLEKPQVFDNASAGIEIYRLRGKNK